MCYDVAWKFDPQDRVAHITTNISPGPDSAHQVDNFRADEIVRIEDPKSPGGQPLFEHE